MKNLLLIAIILMAGCAARDLKPETAAILDHNFKLLEKRIATLENAVPTPKATPSSSK
jgi:hypothetical protein